MLQGSLHPPTKRDTVNRRPWITGCSKSLRFDSPAIHNDLTRAEDTSLKADSWEERNTITPKITTPLDKSNEPNLN